MYIQTGGMSKIKFILFSLYTFRTNFEVKLLFFLHVECVKIKPNRYYACSLFIEVSLCSLVNNCVLDMKNVNDHKHVSNNSHPIDKNYIYRVCSMNSRCGGKFLLT